MEAGDIAARAHRVWDREHGCLAVMFQVMTCEMTHYARYEHSCGVLGESACAIRLPGNCVPQRCHEPKRIGWHEHSRRSNTR